MSKMFDKFKDLLNNGEYDSEEEMCNDLSLNRYDLYEDEEDDE